MFHSYTNTIVGSTTLSTNQIPSHQHEALYQAKTYTVGSGSWNDLPMVLGNETVSDTNFCSTKSTGGGGSHTHSDISQSKTTGNTGSGTSVSIVQSYYTVYIWTRTV